MITACEMKKDFDAIVYNTIITACGEVNNWVETERQMGVVQQELLIAS